jgi:hypothetical protein
MEQEAEIPEHAEQVSDIKKEPQYYNFSITNVRVESEMNNHKNSEL